VWALPEDWIYFVATAVKYPQSETRHHTDDDDAIVLIPSTNDDIAYYEQTWYDQRKQYYIKISMKEQANISMLHDN
jgi:hypothetical protein